MMYIMWMDRSRDIVLPSLSGGKEGGRGVTSVPFTFRARAEEVPEYFCLYLYRLIHSFIHSFMHLCMYLFI